MLRKLSEKPQPTCDSCSIHIVNLLQDVEQRVI